MLLRRISAHVKDQNWFAVFLDFFIVVVGILIAFQITEWREPLGERERSREILAELQTDLKADIAILSDAMNSTLDRIAAGEHIKKLAPEAAITQWENDDIRDSATLSGYQQALLNSTEHQNKGFDQRIDSLRDSLWSTLLDLYNPPSNTASFDSLINSGELGLFQNEALVAGIQDYRFFTKGLAGAQNHTMRASRNISTEVGQLFGLSSFGNVDEDTFIELVKRNPQLAATVQTELGKAKRHFRLKATTKNKAMELLELIEEELAAGSLR